jgi:hypothetical protein
MSRMRMELFIVAWAIVAAPCGNSSGTHNDAASGAGVPGRC